SREQCRRAGRIGCRGVPPVRAVPRLGLGRNGWSERWNINDGSASPGIYNGKGAVSRVVNAGVQRSGVLPCRAGELLTWHVRDEVNSYAEAAAASVMRLPGDRE